MRFNINMTITVEAIAEDVRLINDAVHGQEFRLLGRVVRNLSKYRKQLSAEVLTPFIRGYDSVAASLLQGMADDVPQKVKSIEAQCWCSLLVAVYLLDTGKLSDAVTVLHELVIKVKEHLGPGLDLIGSKVFYFYAVAAEKSGRFAESYSFLLSLYRTACLHHNVSCQASLLNMLLRVLVQSKLYDQASRLISKTTFPETRSNADYARYLYYLGRVKAIRLEYSEAHAKLTNATRKSPKGKSSLGFRIIAQKFAIIVELLMGDIPERAVFNESDIKVALGPYFLITEAVRTGDIHLFNRIVQKYSQRFSKDDTLTLIQRLHHNVLKAGLRAINSTYSRISLSDIAKKLDIASVDEAAGITSKAIVDGVIEATIDTTTQCLHSSWVGDVYSTGEPQKQLHKRIGFCLQLHNETLRAMQFPEADSKPKHETIDDIRRREEEDLLAEDDDDDMML